MNLRIYDFKDYKDALCAYIADPGAGRGYHSKLARAAGCQSSFLSQVLGSHVHLTNDHIAGISDFLGFDEDEHDYVQVLLTIARCSAPRLLRSCRARIEELRRRHQDISVRVAANRLGSGSDEVTYYSAWYWIAIHVLVSIPQYRKPQIICDRLNLPRILVDECLLRLEEMTLVERKGSEWIVTQNHLHLPKDSILTPTHHANWRLQSALKAAMREPDTLQYSVVTAVSREDVQRLKNMLLDFIEKSREVIRPSQEEEMIYIGLDCFRI